MKTETQISLSQRRSFAAYREIKVVTVREEPVRGAALRFDSPELFSKLWRSVIVKCSWYHEDKEHLVCFCLDAKYRIKSFFLVSLGSMNESIAHPREIFRPAIVDSAYALVLAHNHPSGDPTPSRSDIDATRRLYWAADLLQIRFLDHIIVGDSNNYWSFRQSQNWPPERIEQVAAEQNSAPEHGQTIPHGDVDQLIVEQVNDSRRVHAINLSDSQRCKMTRTGTEGSLMKFLDMATDAQLRRMSNLTPVAFGVTSRNEHPRARFLAVENLRPTETEEWQRAKFRRYLIRGELRTRGLACCKSKTP